MADIFRERVLTVHHWTDRQFSFTTTRDPSFRFDLAAARVVVPCLTTSGGFEHTLTAPGGVYLDVEVDGEHRYWDYG